MWSKMLPHAEVLDNSQGLAMLLFAAKNNSKAKIATAPGRLWTFLLRRTLRTVIMSAKADLFIKTASAVQNDSTLPASDSAGVSTSRVGPVRRSGAVELPLEPECSRNSMIMHALFAL